MILKVCGESMAPLLSPGEIVRAERTPVESLRSGDVIVFLTFKSVSLGMKELAIHRLLFKTRGTDGYWRLWAKPDKRWRPNEWPIPASAVLGKVTAISRDGNNWSGIPSIGRLKCRALGLVARLYLLATGRASSPP